MRCTLLAVVVLAACAQGGGTTTDAAIDDAFVGMDAEVCVREPCTIFPPCGCGDQTTCDVAAGGAEGLACRSFNMTGTETSACDSLSDCDRAYVCLGGSEYSSCKKYCTANRDCGTPRGKCIYTVRSDGMPVEGVPSVCSSNCDPTDGDPAVCPASYKCSVFGYNGESIVDCRPAGALVQDQDCKSGTRGDDSRCAPEHLCLSLDNNATFKCHRYCKVGGSPTGCASGKTCLAFSPRFQIGGAEYGVCN